MSFFQKSGSFGWRRLLKGSVYHDMVSGRVHNVGVNFFSTRPYPMRSGYGLGSIVPPGLISGMKKEASIRGDIIQIEELLNDLESTERELILERDAIENNQDSSQTLVNDSDSNKILNESINHISKERSELLKKKLQYFDDLVKLQIENATNRRKNNSKNNNNNNNNNKNNNNNNKEDYNSTFSSNIESPIDWSKSRIDYIDRSDDSIEINAKFFDKNVLSQDSQSHANNIAAAVSGNTKKLGSDKSSKIASAVHHAVTKTQQVHNVESTFLIIAFATHKYVKQFNPLTIDADKLYSAWNYMHPNDKISLNLVGNDALNEATKNENSNNVLHMISEEFLGSCMIGMMHFIKQEMTNTSQMSFSANLKLEITKRIAAIGSVTGDSGIAEQFAGAFSDSLSNTGIDTVFDMIVEGYMPTLQSSIVSDSIKSFISFSPDKMDVSNDENNNKLLFPDMSRIENELINSNKKQSIKQSQSGAMIKATIQGLHDAYVKEYQILDYNTFMNAFQDYCKNGVKMKGIGVPIGINLIEWNKEEVRAIVGRKWDINTMNKSGFGSQQLGQTDGAGNVGRGGGAAATGGAAAGGEAGGGGGSGTRDDDSNTDTSTNDDDDDANQDTANNDDNSGDSADSGDSGDSGDTADTADSGDTGGDDSQGDNNEAY